MDMVLARDLMSRPVKRLMGGVDVREGEIVSVLAHEAGAKRHEEHRGHGRCRC